MLYPGNLSTEHLRKVYVASHGDIAAAVLDSARKDVPIEVDPRIFAD